ncbi:NAD-dependent deacetylase [Ameyamaea chiangmaiensis NBRC 103196]|uniref:NAD-dependent deacylase n=1 Tax=Ameyamaea chiangmaiensis TaxID=442969 RepID=UPI001BB09F64|nr:NAD-dependent deacylase [Ameyamaea chiangmaiensis]MBS4074342.1 NAD-dependent deacylase [Ameyamaea chiangmaiensis]GBQ71706.1 NAD-dependent deacetylase [Ameyamaea chiangmaiensis NBRC 103196]
MKRIVVLTGAGISQESGLETFRDANGLWAHHRIEDVCTPEALARDPALVHRFYNLRRAQLRDVAPNAAHQALAELQAASRAGTWAGTVTIITQNVDDLHERAGSTDVIHMHGRLNSMRCTACEARHETTGDTTPATPCPSCGRPALRPDIVFFGEIPLHMEAITAALTTCDLFVAIGTSGQVYPAAAFVDLVGDAQTLDINIAPSEISTRFDETRLGAAGTLVPRLVRALMEAQHVA